MIKILEDYFLFLTRIFPPEFSKNLTLRFLRLIYSLNLINFFSIKKYSTKTKYLVSSLSFKNRIGIAGGLDKNAEFFHIFGSLGFGFVEVGTITLEPQKGNPKPRIFRFSKDKTWLIL